MAKKASEQYSIDDYRLKEVEVRMYLKEGNSLYSEEPVNSVDKAVSLMREYLRDFDREALCTINLDNKLKPINFHVVSLGDLSGSLVHPRELFKSAILSNAAAVIMCHNHPSGIPEPSQQDIDITERIAQAGEIVGIRLIDHVIAAGGNDSYFSFKESMPGVFDPFDPRRMSGQPAVREEMEEYETGGKDMLLTYEQYINHVQEHVRDYLDNSYANATVAIEQVNKTSESYTGLIVKKAGLVEGLEAVPVINLDRQYKAYRNEYMTNYMDQNGYLDEDDALDESMSIISGAVEEAYEMAKKTDIAERVSKIQDYESVKGSFFVRLVGEEAINRMGNDIPYKKVAEGLYATYHIYLEHNPIEENGFSCAAITNELMEGYGVTLNQLHYDAIKSSVTVMPPVINEMGSIIPGAGDEITILSNRTAMFGASALLYPGVMDHIADKYHGDYFILPSSIHEVLVVRDDGTKDFRELESMVRDINSMVVSPEDKLSDTVYHYDAELGVLETAREFYEGKEKDKVYYNSFKDHSNSVVNEEEAKYLAGERRKVYISLNKAFCYQKESEATSRVYNQMTLPKGTMLDGRDIGGYKISPLYMNENRNNPNEMTATYYIPKDRPLEVKLIKGVDSEKVDIEKIKEAVDNQKAAYREAMKEQSRSIEKVQNHVLKKEKDQGEEL